MSKVQSRNRRGEAYGKVYYTIPELKTFSSRVQGAGEIPGKEKLETDVERGRDKIGW